MSGQPPLIGIIATQYAIGSERRPFVGAFPAYYRSVLAAGGLPALIPLGLPAEKLTAILARADGLLLTGGGDINPALYGEPAHPTTRSILDERDAAEQAAVLWAVEHDLPVLGICRGHQMVNAALGGKLLQDIPSLCETNLRHDEPDSVPLETIAHPVNIVEDSTLAKLVGSSTAQVNSRHHQCVTTLGEGMIATAWAPDGILEGSEMPGASFLVTVQWHPENLLFNPDGVTLRLFEGLINAAQARQQQ